jgi:acylphosphatase
VQGVFFRQSAFQLARRAGVGGWIRNLGNGQVEAVFEGPKPAVEALVEWCRTGPPAALVSDVEVRWESPKGEGPFRVR